MIYLAALLMALICAVYNRRFDSASRRLLYWGLCIFVILILGLRYRVGIDTLNYMLSYDKMPDWDTFKNLDISEQEREPGWLILSILCRTFTHEFWPLQFVMAAITNICTFIFIKRYCKNIFIGVFFYFLIVCLYFTTEIIRESAAIAIFLVNYENIEKKRWLKYYILSFLSIAFHYSAIIIWFFPFVKFLKFNVLYVCLCVFSFIITPYVEQLNALLTFTSITNRVEHYISYADSLNLNWRIAQLLTSALPPILCLIINRKKNIIKDEYFKGILLLQILLCFAAFSIPMVFSRFTNYTILFYIVVLSNIITISRVSRMAKIGLLSIVLVLSAYNYSSKYNQWFPYSSVLNPTKSQDRENQWRVEFKRF